MSSPGNLENDLLKVLEQHPACGSNAMELYYYYIRYKKVPLLLFFKVFYSIDYRKSMGVTDFEGVSRRLRTMKHTHPNLFDKKYIRKRMEEIAERKLDEMRLDDEEDYYDRETY